MKALIIALILAPLLLLGCAGYAGLSKKDNAGANATSIAYTPIRNVSTDSVGRAPHNASTLDYGKLQEEVIPAAGIALNSRWGNVGPKTVGSGALNISKLAAVMAANGRPLTTAQMEILKNGSDEPITIGSDNAQFMLDLFWAFGLANNNHILSQGVMSQDKASIPDYASTGGWTLGDRDGGALFSSSNLLMLDAKQQAIVDEVAGGTYRPCCDNPTAFPDCNHGMAALGLAEWMASQNASKEEIYSALLAANSYWFPQTYIQTAAYFELRNESWKTIDPKEVLSADYSSISGYRKTQQKLKGLPAVALPTGGSCGA